MEIKVVENKLAQALEKPEQEKIVQEYISDYVEVLNELGITGETANLAIKGIDLDHGIYFLDTFARIKKKAVQSSWKIVRECDDFKINEGQRALKLTSAFVSSAFNGNVNTMFILGSILTVLVSFYKKLKQKENKPEIYQIVREYILEKVTRETKLPELKDIKMSPDNVVLFCDIIKKSCDAVEEKELNKKIPEAKLIEKWIITVSTQAKEAKEFKDREKNIPSKKSEELRKLADYFKNLEDELDKSIIENSKLAIDNKKLQEEVYELEDQKQELSVKIGKLEKKIDDLHSEVNKANQEVNERKKLNDAQVQYRKNAQISLLQDIAMALKAEYGDYAETKDSPMDEELGEIYREKLKQIFKILEQKGIKVEM